MFKGAIKAFVIDYDPMLLKMGTVDEASPPSAPRCQDEKSTPHLCIS